MPWFSERRDGFGDLRADVLAAACDALEEFHPGQQQPDLMVLTTLVKLTADAQDEQRLRNVFGLLLDLVDRKDCGTDDRARAASRARAWTATHVMRSTLLPLVLECLRARRIDSVASLDAPRGSRIGDNAGITQESASTLASAFTVLDDWRLSDPDNAIPLLRENLFRWTLHRSAGRIRAPRCTRLHLGVCPSGACRQRRS